MRPGFLLSSAACVLAATPGSADEFKNPPVVEVRSPGGDLTVRARRGTASVPGLGDVEHVYGYEVRRGTAFPREGSGPTTIELMIASTAPAAPSMWPVADLVELTLTSFAASPKTALIARVSLKSAAGTIEVTSNPFS